MTDKSDKTLIAEWQRHYQNALPAYAAWEREADDFEAFREGMQWSSPSSGETVVIGRVAAGTTITHGLIKAMMHDRFVEHAEPRLWLDVESDETDAVIKIGTKV